MELEGAQEIEVTMDQDLPQDPSPPLETPPENAPPPETGGQTSPPAYAPNFKYKVLKEEKEFPEWVRTAVTTPEMEKTVREIFEKADGLETVKSHRDHLVKEVETFQKELMPFISDAQEALEFAKKGDLESFFEKVGIPDDQLFKYALHKLNLREDPAKLTAHEQARRRDQEIARLQSENQYWQESQKQLAVNQKEFELTSHLGRAEISPMVNAFDGVRGPGAFRAEVIRRGLSYSAQGIDAPVETVVAEVANFIGWQGQKSTPQPTFSAEPGTRTPPPSLPNIQGSGTSPAKRVSRSTDDLRRLARELKDR